jgi:hypothetical protein
MKFLSWSECWNPQDSCVADLTPKVTALRNRVFGVQLGYMGGDLRETVTHSAKGRHSEKRSSMKQTPRKSSLFTSRPASTLMLTSQPPELEEIKLCSLQATCLNVCCYSNLSSPRASTGTETIWLQVCVLQHDSVCGTWLPHQKTMQRIKMQKGKGSFPEVRYFNKVRLRIIWKK